MSLKTDINITTILYIIMLKHISIYILVDIATGEKYKQTLIFFSEIYILYIRPKKKLVFPLTINKNWIHVQMYLQANILILILYTMYKMQVIQDRDLTISDRPKIARKTIGRALKLGSIGQAETHAIFYFGLNLTDSEQKKYHNTCI